jgi:starvation-inducible DNA-binding protein
VPKTKSTTTQSTRIDIAKAKREQVGDILNQLLADCSDLAMRTKHAHWNVTGAHFIALHKYFDELYEVIGEHSDEIAERAAALGGFVHGRLSDAASNTRLKEFPTDVREGLQVVRVLADSVGQFSNSVREAIDQTEELEDMVTSDMLNGISGSLDKHLWFLEAHLR